MDSLSVNPRKDKFNLWAQKAQPEVWGVHFKEAQLPAVLEILHILMAVMFSRTAPVHACTYMK